MCWTCSAGWERRDIIRAGRSRSSSPHARARPASWRSWCRSAARVRSRPSPTWSRSQVGGVVIRRASLHNEDEIRRKDIRIGDTVLLERAGDVIPTVVQVVRAKRPRGARPFRFPRRCPVCGGIAERPAGEAVRRCVRATCPAQVKARLRHFGSRRAHGHHAPRAGGDRRAGGARPRARFRRSLPTHAGNAGVAAALRRPLGAEPARRDRGVARARARTAAERPRHQDGRCGGVAPARRAVRKPRPAHGGARCATSAPSPASVRGSPPRSVASSATRATAVSVAD